MTLNNLDNLKKREELQESFAWVAVFFAFEEAVVF